MEISHSTERTSGNGTLSSRSGTLVAFAFWLMLAIGLALRIWGAWAYRHEAHYDRGRPALMAKHIAEGRDFPVFGYGTAYLGSTEPAVSALMCRLIGTSGFAVNLGTAVFGFLILPLAYFWGRESGGRIAGLSSLAYSMLGPFGNYFFSFAPRGGYAATNLFGALAIYLTGLIIARERHHPGQGRPGLYILLGCVGGLGWWTNQLVTAALLTCAIWLAAMLRTRMINRNTLLAAIFFFLASAPWWIWNYFNGWATFGFGGTIGGTCLRTGLTWFFRDRLFTLVNVPLAWGPVRYVIPLLFLAGGVASILLLIGQIRRNRSANHWIFLGLTLTFIAISALLFAKSTFSRIPSPRYLTPIVPALGVLFGVVTAWLFDRIRRHKWLAFAPLAILLIGQWNAFAREFKGAEPDVWLASQELAQFSRENDIQVVFAEIWLNWINFAAGGQVVIHDMFSEPYEPNQKTGHFADRIGLINDHLQLSWYLRATECHWQEKWFGPLMLMYNFAPAPRPAKPVPRTQMEQVTDHLGNDVRHIVTSGRLDNYWAQLVEKDGTPAFIHIRLKEPQWIHGVRLLCAVPDYPASVRVEARLTTRSDEWENLLSPTFSTPYCWSGPRWYVEGLFFNMMYRFTPDQEADEIRVYFDPHPDYPFPLRLQELELLGELDETPPEEWKNHLDALIHTLRGMNAARCYADRWLSTKILELAGDTIETIQPTFMQRTIYSPGHASYPEYADIEELSTHDLFVTPHAEADNLRAVFAARNLPVEERESGPWTLFRLTDPDLPETATRWPGLKWMGFGLLEDDLPFGKKRGLVFIDAASRTGDPDKRLDFLLKASRLIPGDRQILQQAIEAAAHRPEKQQRLEAELAAITPDTTLDIRFENGIELIGLATGPLELRPGQPLDLRYFWHCPDEIDPVRFAVFAHIRHERGNRFQADHVLLEQIGPSALAPGHRARTLVYTHREIVPADMPPGEYAIHLGLYDRVTGRRLRSQSPHPVNRRAITLPLKVTIQNDSP